MNNPNGGAKKKLLEMIREFAVTMEITPEDLTESILTLIRAEMPGEEKCPHHNLNSKILCGACRDARIQNAYRQTLLKILSE